MVLTAGTRATVGAARAARLARSFAQQQQRQQLKLGRKAGPSHGPSSSRPAAATTVGTRLSRRSPSRLASSCSAASSNQALPDDPAALRVELLGLGWPAPQPCSSFVGLVPRPCSTFAQPEEMAARLRDARAFDEHRRRGPAAQLASRVGSGVFAADPAQTAAAEQLQRLHEDLHGYEAAQALRVTDLNRAVALAEANDADEASEAGGGAPGCVGEECGLELAEWTRRAEVRPLGRVVTLLTLVVPMAT